MRVHDREGSGAGARGWIAILVKSRLPLLLLPLLLVAVHVLVSGAVVTRGLHCPAVRTIVADYPSSRFQTVPCSQQRGHLVLTHNLVVRVNILIGVMVVGGN